MKIIFDVSRLITHIRRAAPTGIDRVDLAYARLLNEGEGPVDFLSGGVSPSWSYAKGSAPIGRLLQRDWATRSADGDAVYQDLCARLVAPSWPLSEGAGVQRLAARESPALGPLARLARVFKSRHAGINRLPADLRGAVFLHTSHNGLENAGLIQMVKARRGAVAVMLHDLIPIDFPEFCRPREAERHEARLLNIQRHADLVLANSTYTRDRFRAWAARGQLPLPPIVVVPLGLDDCYLEPGACPPPLFTRPYFVTVGTIEPRKNQAFLLKVWRRLAETLGEACPRLVIVGRRGWECEAVEDLLERSSPLTDTVIEVSGLGDAALATLMLGARGVLQPSLVEGFGLPFAEAQALGVAALASDIAAHREIASADTPLLDPLDGPAWISQITALASVGRPARNPQSGRFFSQTAHVKAARDAIDRHLTAVHWANDHAFREVFSRQVEAHGAASGVFLGLSLMTETGPP